MTRPHAAPSSPLPTLLQAAALLLVAGAGDLSADVRLAQPIADALVERPGVMEFTGRLIVRPSPGLAAHDRARAVRLLARFPMRHDPRTDEFVIEVGGAGPLQPGIAEAAVAEELLASGLFRYAEPDWLVFPCGEPDDPRYAEQWHHVTVGSAAAWALHRGDADDEIIVGICDTGIVPHEDLPFRVPGYNAVRDLAEIDGGDVTDIHGHGTHVAGCAAAAGDNGVGTVGMGWRFRVLPVRVSEAANGGASMSNLLAGARWAAENGAKVVSVSYSGIGNAAIESTGAYLRSLDASLLWAAGNSGVDHAGWDFEHVIVVGASDPSDGPAGFSGYGRGVDLFAPGVAILAPTRFGGYAAWSGTSMATPVVNGALALVRSANPALSAAHAEHVLFHSCEPWGGMANSERYGWGRLDLALAVERALVALVPQPPEARDDRVQAIAGSAIEIDALANDWDPNMDPLWIASHAAATSTGRPVSLVPGVDGGRDRLRIDDVGPDPGTQTFDYTLVEPTSGATSSALVTIEVTAARPASHPIGVEPGLEVAYYELFAPSVLPDFGRLSPYASEVVPQLAFPSTDGEFAGSGRADDVGAVFAGWLDVPESGFWTLGLTSDDGSRLWIGSDLVVDNDGLHGMVTVRDSRALAAGLHPIRVEFFERSGGAGVILAWSGPNRSTQWVPAARLFHGGYLEIADLNGDGRVGGEDLAILLSEWGASGSPADLDASGIVDGGDLAILLARWDA
jgi:subtilisin family serine protease